MEIVQSSKIVIGNYLQISPDVPVKDNSVYEILLSGLKSVDGKVLPPRTIRVYTAFTPGYATLADVKSLIDGLEVPDEKIMYHVREASKHAAYIKGASITGTPAFEVVQFVRYKAAHDSLLAYYISMTADSQVKKGQIGDTSFETISTHQDIANLLKYLKAQIKDWQDALLGYKNPGFAKPVATVRGKTASPTMNTVNLDYERGL